MKQTNTILIASIVLFAGATIGAGYRNGVAVSALQNDDIQPVPISRALFCNRDSVMHYYEQGLRFNDPKGLFVIGVAAHLRADGMLPEEIYAPSVTAGDSCLLLSAQLGYTDALQAIRCLSAHGRWNNNTEP